MNSILQINFHKIQHSDAVAMVIQKKAEKLEKFYSRILSCRVTVELPHKRRNQGKIFRILIDLTIPGHEIVVGKDREKNHSHEDVFVAIRDAFDAVERKLRDHVRRLPRQRHHEMSPHARVIRILRGDGDYGFLQTADGREIYFHKNSVLCEQFERLQIGTVVRFKEEMGEEGPQASTVEIVGHPKENASSLEFSGI